MARERYFRTKSLLSKNTERERKCQKNDAFVQVQFEYTVRMSDMSKATFNTTRHFVPRPLYPLAPQPCVVGNGLFKTRIKHQTHIFPPKVHFFLKKYQVGVEPLPPRVHGVESPGEYHPRRLVRVHVAGHVEEPLPVGPREGGGDGDLEQGAVLDEELLPVVDALELGNKKGIPSLTCGVVYSFSV